MSEENLLAEAPQSSELYRDMEALSARDWQLWSICALMLVARMQGEGTLEPQRAVTERV